MGILDQYLGDTDMQSPQNQQMMSIAAALLQAGGPSRTPVSFGQAFGNAMQAGNQAYQSAQDRALMRQMKDEDLKLKQLSEKRAQQSFDQQQAWMKKLTGDTGDYGNHPQAQQISQSVQQPLKLGMGADGNMGFQSQPNIQAPAPQQGQMQQRPQSGGIQNLSLDDLGMAAVAGIPGAKELLDIKKFQLNGIKRENATYIDPVTGKQQYFADPTKGLDYNPETKTVSNLNGFNQANAAMKGAETAAVEAAKAQYDFQPMAISQPVQLPNGQILQPGTYSLSKAQIAEINNAQQGQFNAPRQAPQGQPMQGQAPAQGLPQPTNPTQAEFVGRTAAFRAAQPQEYNDRIKIYQDELAKETDPVAISRLNREITRLKKEQATGSELPANFSQPQGQSPQNQQFAPQPQQSRFGIQIQSEAEKQAAIEAAKKAAALQFDPQIKGAEGRTATDVEREKVKPKMYAALQGAINKLDSLYDEALAIYDNPALEKITGLSGKFPDIPGSEAASLRARIETLKAKTGFGELQSMRSLSPTGGALGGVSEQENKYLQNSVSSLDTNQGLNAFKDSLKRLLDQTRASKNILINGFNAEYGDTQSNPSLQNVTAANNANKPQSRIVKIDGGGSAGAKLGADGNYYVLQKNGKWAKVVE